MSIFKSKHHVAEASVFTYQLVDGSYIMAEEVDYDFESNSIIVINPVKIEESDEKYSLRSWIITDPSQPVTLKDDNIIASAIAPTALKHNYFQFNTLSHMKNILTNSDFDEIIKLLFPVVDSIGDSESNDFDFNEPYKIKKSKDKEDKNPWDRY